MLKNKNIFLTGVTGLVGSYLLKILLEHKNKVYVLARSKDNKSAQDRVIDILKFWDEGILDKGFLANLNVIDGDITFPDLGIKAKRNIETLISEVEIIFHSAALAELSSPLEVIRRINVGGTRNILNFALECKKRGSLKKVNHISTAYVVGAKKGIEFSEDMLELGQEFSNTYEQTKYEAELLVKEYLANGLNISIFRPGMIMGDSKQGKTNNFRLFYQPLHFFSQGIYDEFPMDRDFPQNLINVDTVAEVIFLLGEREEPAVYHLVSPYEVPMGWIFKLAADYFGFEMPKFIPLKEFNFNKWTSVQKALAEPYIPYFNHTVKFLSQKTEDILKGYDFRYPEIDKDNIMRNLAYCHKAGFIKRRA